MKNIQVLIANSGISQNLISEKSKSNIIFIIMRNSFKEHFDSFSPYKGNDSYPFVYEKHLDDVKLQETLNKWETPFNIHNEGYYNAEPGGNPPFAPY